MTFQVDIDGRTRQVTVERTSEQDRFRLTVDGTTVVVDAVRADPLAWSILVPATGASHAATIAEGSVPGELVVTIGPHRIPVAVDGRRPRRGPQFRGASGVQRVTAPMPGKVLRVFVQVGDDVVARQPLVVIEAMKMENALTASRPGRVTEIAAVEGGSVEAGRLLVVIE
jgi:biotin carboxyl carrier protein